MKWQRDDYLTDAISLAPRLIGAVLVHRTSHGRMRSLWGHLAWKKR